MLYLAYNIRPQSNSRLSKSLREIRFSYLGLKTCPAASLSASLIYLVLCPAACALRSSTSCGCPPSLACSPPLHSFPSGAAISRAPPPLASASPHLRSYVAYVFPIPWRLPIVLPQQTFLHFLWNLIQFRKLLAKKKSIQKADTICTNQLITVSQNKTNKISSPIHLGSACLHYFSGYQRKLNFRTGSCMFATSAEKKKSIKI